MDTFLLFVGCSTIQTISKAQWPMLTFNSLYCEFSFITLRCNATHMHTLVKMLYFNVSYNVIQYIYEAINLNLRARGRVVG
jgi:hypothetical protein